MLYEELAPAKINLSLHICGKRADGYHLLHSLVAFANIGDRITVTPADTFILEITGPFATHLNMKQIGPIYGSDNLVYKAANLLTELTGAPLKAHIILEKNLPVSSGIGGGSSDAAATIKALRSLWSVTPDAAKLQNALVKLGADLPVCYAAQTTIMEGIGETLTPYKGLPSLPVVLANPLIPCPTGAVFNNFDARFSAPATIQSTYKSAEALAEFLTSQCKNDLQDAAIKTIPAIKNVLQALEQTPVCLLARLSGSGATCFGIYPTQEQAATAAQNLQEHHPDWWIKSGILE